MGPADSKPAIAMRGGGRWVGPRAGDQVSQSGQARVWLEADTGDWPSGCWFLKGPFLSGTVVVPLPRGTHSDHNANHGWNGGLDKDTREWGEEVQLKKKTKKQKT